MSDDEKEKEWKKRFSKQLAVRLKAKFDDSDLPGPPTKSKATNLSTTGTVLSPPVTMNGDVGIPTFTHFPSSSSSSSDSSDSSVSSVTSAALAASSLPSLDVNGLSTRLDVSV
eukprot:CAMPEP_0114343002 /NCGR_PEP_ID=MMETSP0101-20121206/10257_1 /TAXON_ID=38822 ORGANISM="Pteridomonas danica, Strain PT" /NCGR_SAMPLE_ID=MMETSP0101 /ASSEMBLY_ACC=CAM_ASM_000211 /LENGTH=112 /DNA_ID=CAMNT_0001477461 /DNA_START=130 /DNA_END=468 /DNA_ORIENTATION=-